MAAPTATTSIARPRVDLYSDTVSRPTDGMRRAIAEAEVGNEQAGEDPTVNRLQAMVAELLGKEMALFLPSGTMCNEIAYRVWCDHGDEIILDATSHALHFETGGPGALAGVMTRPVSGDRGIFTGAQVEAVIRPKTRHAPRQKLVSIENTANLGGGAIWPLEQVADVAAVARAHGMRVHMDGARLLNAVVASGISAARFAAEVDSAWIDLSKGLGCPIGGVLAGSAAFIEEAWRFKHQFGGAMRQAGIVAAAGVYALEHHVDRLADDHTRAKRLADGIADLRDIAVDANRVDTNMVYFDVSGTGVDGPEFSRRLMAEHQVRIGAMSASSLRAVTHLDVDDRDIETAIAAIRAVTAEA
ncbi:MAG: aminotransferase class I/II-fold pyridoxal phosphate-dependent enzyme [Alphaproteobacteria bacterium]|nr:aminotransferase class I/II-fold pyridoxal phosphate-dependent enzyme [Alphaproteobacteria bacterium]